MISLQKLMDDLFSAELVADFKCTQCHQQGHIHMMDRIVQLPSELLITIQRTCSEDQKSFKIMRPVNFPNQLDMSSYMCEVLLY